MVQLEAEAGSSHVPAHPRQLSETLFQNLKIKKQKAWVAAQWQSTR